jgi:hypothetical protein
MPRDGVLGILSVSGFPGRYSVRTGLTGPEIANGTPKEILSALADQLRNEDGSKVEILFPPITFHSK